MSQRLTTSLIEGAEPRLELEDAEVKITGGPDKGLTVKLGPDSLLIGSASTCDIVLHDPTVSSRHAELIAGTNGYAIRDLGSTNGIWIGTVPVERAPLVDGMKLRLGSTTIAVKTLGTRRSIALEQPGRFGGMVAHSVKMRALVATISQVAASDVTVLIEGETGTGKEVTAQAIHSASSRAHAPFVVFDCGAVPANLIAAELFGHAKGAYTGASTTHAGMLEQAEGGTLFLDEIGELPLELQPMLLGAIERKRSRPVGGQAEVDHDVRFVAATNRNLEELVRAGQFRKDLYFRLAVARLRLPPLRERPEDVPILAEQFASECGISLSHTVRALLGTHDWPGNVRELKNLITASATNPNARPLALDTARPSSQVTLASITDANGDLLPFSEVRRIATDEAERTYLRALLDRARGNVTKAAQLAGVTRQYLGRVMARHGM